MFTEMITSLRDNQLPSIPHLKGRLHIALIKKEAILSLPASFRVSDPKMNPTADHMLWAAIVIGDLELIEITVTILLTEGDGQANHPDVIQASLDRLLAIPSAPNLIETLRSTIKPLTNEIFPDHHGYRLERNSH